MYVLASQDDDNKFIWDTSLVIAFLFALEASVAINNYKYAPIEPMHAHMSTEQIIYRTTVLVRVERERTI